MPGVVNRQGIDATMVKMELDGPHLATHVRSSGAHQYLLCSSIFGVGILPAIVDVVH